MKESEHVPALLNEVVEGLDLKPGDNVIDATFGGGGHAREILKATAPLGKLLGIDWDSQAIERARGFLEKYQNRIILKQGNYTQIKEITYGSGLANINAVVLDLGLSTDQLADQTRGFSFQKDGPLDMRFSADTGLTARQIVNEWSAQNLVSVFREYGEERHAARVANFIIAARKRAPLTSVNQLKELVLRGVGKHGGKIHPATRIFQALRIAVNSELKNLASVLPIAVSLLNSGGRLGVISFHSLEDRIVKNFLKRESRDCVCSSDIPRCVCDHHASIKIINKKVITPSAEEVKTNPASRSAKLRIGERLR